MKFLVTGATGFVGSAIIRELVRRGHSVRALVRPGSAQRLDHSHAVEVATGDVTDSESLNTAMAGISGVFHIAAVYSYWHRDPSETYQVNVDGTVNVLRVAQQNGVPRAVLTSTVATLKWPGHGQLADEDSVATLDELPGHYKQSKLLAEQAALDFNGADLEVVITNPTAPFGPGDARPTPTGRIVLEFLNRRFPGYVSSGVNVCDVDDVAIGHVLAFEKGRAGERYILGSENLTLREVYETLGEVTGLNRRPLRVPMVLAKAAGAVDSIIEGRLLRREPYIPLEGLRVAEHPLFVGCSKAKSELGFNARPAAEALRRSAEWFIANGYSRARIVAGNQTERDDEAEASA